MVLTDSLSEDAYEMFVDAYVALSQQKVTHTEPPPIQRGFLQSRAGLKDKFGAQPQFDTEIRSL